VVCRSVDQLIGLERDQVRHHDRRTRLILPTWADGQDRPLLGSPFDRKPLYVQGRDGRI
jgi:hypothetical protein